MRVGGAVIGKRYLVVKWAPGSELGTQAAWGELAEG